LGTLFPFLTKQFLKRSQLHFGTTDQINTSSANVCMTSMAH